MRLKALQYLSFLIGIFAFAAVTAASGDEAHQNNDKASDFAPSGSELAGGWHLVRTRDPNGGADAISIMHIADISRSDLGLAGLMIRCSRVGSEAVIVLLQPFPARARPNVVLGKNGKENQFEAQIVPPGTAALLPVDAMGLVRGLWQTQNDLYIRIDDGHSLIRGVVPLKGLQSAFEILMMNCRAQ